MNLPPAFKHRGFVLFWLGLMISQAGSQMQLWGVFWNIRQLNSNPIAISLIGLARFMPGSQMQPAWRLLRYVNGVK